MRAECVASETDLVRVDTSDVQVAAVAGPVTLGEDDFLDVGEELTHPRHAFLTHGDHAVDLPQLCEADSILGLGHAVVEADGLDAEGRSVDVPEGLLLADDFSELLIVGEPVAVGVHFAQILSINISCFHGHLFIVLPKGISWPSGGNMARGTPKVCPFIRKLA